MADGMRSANDRSVGWAAVTRLRLVEPTRPGASRNLAPPTVAQAASGSAPDRQGFTLIELLVAMAVFSLAALALLNLSAENTRSAARVETRTLGGILAENLAVESMTASSVGEGTTTGQTLLAERRWRWTRTVVSTDAPDLVRVHITVNDAEGQAAERTLFRSRARS
ncbi:MAG: proteinral secretion pathway protein I [bacterium]|nr:MAG: proteinral secretion pathway protein I [bacterium]